MPRFLVTLCRKTYEYAEVEVDAADLPSAQAAGLESGDSPTTTWEPQDGGIKCPEVLDVEELPL